MDRFYLSKISFGIECGTCSAIRPAKMLIISKYPPVFLIDFTLKLWTMQISTQCSTREYSEKNALDPYGIKGKCLNKGDKLRRHVQGGET
jgi:hypothetical protein